MSDSPPESLPPPAAPARSWLLRTVDPALWIAVLALAFAAWQWYDGRGEAAALREETAAKLQDSRLTAAEARAAIAAAQAKLASLESRFADAQDQRIALDALHQELASNRDDWAYAEIEQSLFIAGQQLALAGNVKAALAALQAADNRLRRMDRPQLAALRKAVNSDIERLKAAPHVDTLAISARLDALIAQVDRLPLAMEARPQPAELRSETPGAAESGPWARFWTELWGDLSKLVRVERMDKAEPALLAPSQAFFLRENLRLRLIGARLALLARDATSYKADLKAARDWLGRYYATRNNNVARALANLRTLHDAEVGIEAPEISATLEAMRNLRAARARGQR
ncbi:MAG TPA: uroporphyrinogen-III C-methyltransferase [Burkholderiales bacterium]|nr:uroporphyrinogen-III C-methyltransferase [Burkholderiales bacterium]